jgi:hypothetical protein
LHTGFWPSSAEADKVKEEEIRRKTSLRDAAENIAGSKFHNLHSRINIDISRSTLPEIGSDRFNAPMHTAVLTSIDTYAVLNGSDQLPQEVTDPAKSAQLGRKNEIHKQRHFKLFLFLIVRCSALAREMYSSC